MTRVTKPGRGRGRWSRRPRLAKPPGIGCRNITKIAKPGAARPVVAGKAHRNRRLNLARVTKPGRGLGRWSRRPGLAKSHRSRTHHTAKIAKVGPAREGAGLSFWGVGQNRQKNICQKDDNIVTLPARKGPKKARKMPKKARFWPCLARFWHGWGGVHNFETNS